MHRHDYNHISWAHVAHDIVEWAGLLVLLFGIAKVLGWL